MTRAWIFLAFTALIPIVRVLADPLHVVTGTPMSDASKHVWSFWHVLTWSDWPRTPYLNAPGGGVLLDLLSVPALLLAPVTATLGAAASANLWVWLNVWATGVATYALAAALSPGRGAILAGMLAQTAPYMLGYPLASGVHERLMVWVFPLLALAVWRCRQERAPRWIVLATLGFLLTGLGCQAYVLYSVVLGLLGLPLWLGPWGRVRVHARRLAPLGVSLALAAAIVWAHTRWLTEDPWALMPRPDVTVPVFGPAGRGAAAIAGASLSGLLDPWTVHATGARVSGDELYELVYVGWIPLLTALAGAWLVSGPARRFIRGLTALGFGMALLSIGPIFSAFGMYFVEPVHVAVSWIVPFYGAYPPAWQQVAAFSPLVAPAIAVVLVRAPRLGLLLVVGALVERAAVLPISIAVPATRLDVPAPYLSVGVGPLVDIPRVIGRTPLAPGLYFLAQTRHHQPMMASINPGNSAWDAYLPVLRGVAKDWGSAADCLRRGGLRWVVIHRTWFDDSSLAARAASGLSAAAGPPIADDGNVAVYDLGVPTASLSLPPPTVQAFELMKRGWIGRPATSLTGLEGTVCPAGSTDAPR